MTGSTNQRGASLLELMMVSVLLGILSTLAVIQVGNSVDQYLLVSQAEQLAAELNAARTIAVARGTVIQIRFNAAANSMVMFDSNDMENPLRYSKFLYDGVSFGSVPSDPITFSSRGVATAGAITLTGESGSVTIQVDSSGRASVSPMEANHSL